MPKVICLVPLLRPAVMIVLLSIPLYGVGCAGTPSITIPVAENAIERHEDAATLVVIQPGTNTGWLNLLSQDGVLLGQLHHRGITTVKLAPGSFRLYLVLEDYANFGDRLEGEVEAGKVYYATISARLGGVKINALNPRSRENRWANREIWLKERPFMKMDPARVTEVTVALGDPAPLLATIDAFVNESLDEAHREARRVRASDGL